MTTGKRTNDIPIADDEWIEFSLTWPYDHALDIDGHIAELWPLIDRLEFYCVPGCCGFDAYDFTRERINGILPEFDCVQLYASCEQAKRRIEAIDSSVFVSTRMNNFADRDVFIRLLEHLAACISERIAGQNNIAGSSHAE